MIEKPTRPTSYVRRENERERLIKKQPGGWLSKFDFWGRLGFRARVVILITLGALLLSTSMGAIAYFTTQHLLIQENQKASLRQAYVNARLLRDTLEAGQTRFDQLLEAIDSGSNSSHSILEVNGAWYARTTSFGQQKVPAALQAMVTSGTPGTETFLLGSTPEFAIGIPIPAVHGAYFEVFNISGIGKTLRVLALALYAAGFATTLLGALVGRSTNRRSFRPLSKVSQAAVAIAGGELSTRLSVDAHDPDLDALTNSFNAMVDQLEERIEREERFTSDVSHELRSPLTTVLASLGVLEARTDSLPRESRHALALLADDVRRFERMVGDLLEISRSDTGVADIFLEDVAAGTLVRRAIEASSHVLPDGMAPPRIEVHPDVEGAWLAVDKRRFERVMINLMENAALYAHGPTLVAVTPGPAHNGGAASVWIVVEDRGPGLSLNDRTKVFERFYRGSTAGDRGANNGSGLGLALVKEHVRLQKGSVWVEESNCGGSRFIVALPQTPIEELS